MMILQVNKQNSNGDPFCRHGTGATEGRAVLTSLRPRRELSGPHITGREPQARKAYEVTHSRKQRLSQARPQA